MPLPHDPRIPFPDKDLELDVQAGLKFLQDGVEPQVVFSAMALTALKLPEVEHDVMRAVSVLTKQKPEVVLRALVSTIQDRNARKEPLSPQDVLGGGSAPSYAPPVAPSANIPPGPRNLSPLSGGVAPAGAPDPGTFGPQDF